MEVFKLFWSILITILFFYRCFAGNLNKTSILSRGLPRFFNGINAVQKPNISFDSVTKDDEICALQLNELLVGLNVGEEWALRSE